MNHKSVKFKAFITILICILSLTSCGKTVGSDENSEISEKSDISDNTETDNSVISESTAELTDNNTGLLTPSASGITLSYNEAEIIAGQTIKYPEVSETIAEVWTSSDESVATVDTVGNITGISEGNCIIKVFSESDSNIFAEVKVTVSKPEGIQQIDGITYVNGILIANKTYSLPSTYNPDGLTDATYTAFQELSAAALSDGLDIYISSGFRSYEYQNEISNNYVETSGQETADTF